MIIRGGTIFILDGDVLPTVTITDATVVLEHAGNEFSVTEYISQRVGTDSEVTRCHIMSWDFWSEQTAKESIVKATLARKPRTDTIMQRLYKLLRLGAS